MITPSIKVEDLQFIGAASLRRIPTFKPPIESHSHHRVAVKQSAVLDPPVGWALLPDQNRTGKSAHPTNARTGKSAYPTNAGTSFAGVRLIWAVALLFVLTPGTLVGQSNSVAIPIEVERNDGETFSATMDSISSDELVCQAGSESVTLLADALASVRFPDSELRTVLRTSIQLRNGSQVSARSVSLESDKLAIRLPRQPALSIDISKVNSIRLQGPSATTDPIWLGVRDQESRGDRLVIRRPGEKLDIVEGLILGIAEEKVSFDMEGDQIAAPMDKLEGVLFGGRSAPTGTPAIQVTDTYGSTWMVDAIQAAGPDVLQITIDADAVHEIPLSLVKSIRWSGGRVVLASEPMATNQFDPGAVSGELQGLMQQFFGPQNDRASDLVMRGNSLAAYRIDDGFERATGKVKFDSSVQVAGQVVVRIKLDDQIVWEQSLENANPLGFDIKINDSNRISFEVDCKGSGNIGSTVRWINPKLMK